MEMGSLPLPERSLDVRPTFVPKTISDFLKEVSMITDVSDKVLRVDDFIKVLEHEFTKIDALKRELPLCLRLLNDAILFLKDELMQCTESKSKPVLEEFIPLKKNCDNNENDQLKKEDSRDKKNWMSSVQLWNGDDQTSSEKPIFDSKPNSELEYKKGNLFANKGAFQACKNGSESRAFIPLKAYSGLSKKDGSDKETAVPGLSLLTPGIKSSREESGSTGSRFSCTRSVSSSAPNSQSNIRNIPQSCQQQSARKQRRCWSPDLHRRFVNALEQLGGCQVATPKQIRELIQVDGLTNDEVKSHLQKFRLHSRRILPTSASFSAGIWMSQDRCCEFAKTASSQSGSPQGPLELAGKIERTSATEVYRMEDDEDAKSNGYSCKNHVKRSEKDDVWGIYTMSFADKIAHGRII